MLFNERVSQKPLPTAVKSRPVKPPPLLSGNRSPPTPPVPPVRKTKDIRYAEPAPRANDKYNAPCRIYMRSGYCPRGFQCPWPHPKDAATKETIAAAKAAAQRSNTNYQGPYPQVQQAIYGSSASGAQWTQAQWDDWNNKGYYYNDPDRYNKDYKK